MPVLRTHDVIPGTAGECLSGAMNYAPVFLVASIPANECGWLVARIRDDLNGKPEIMMLAVTRSG
jgi:hypothetical protein